METQAAVAGRGLMAEVVVMELDLGGWVQEDCWFRLAAEVRRGVAAKKEKEAGCRQSRAGRGHVSPAPT